MPPPPTEDRKRVTRVLGRLRVSAGDIEPRPVLPCRHRTHVAWTVNPHVFADTPASRGKERDLRTAEQEAGKGSSDRTWAARAENTPMLRASSKREVSALGRTP